MSDHKSNTMADFLTTFFNLKFVIFYLVALRKAVFNSESPESIILSKSSSQTGKVLRVTVKNEVVQSELF